MNIAVTVSQSSFFTLVQTVAFNVMLRSRGSWLSWSSDPIEFLIDAAQKRGRYEDWKDTVGICTITTWPMVQMQVKFLIYALIFETPIFGKIWSHFNYIELSSIFENCFWGMVIRDTTLTFIPWIPHPKNYNKQVQGGFDQFHQLSSVTDNLLEPCQDAVIVLILQLLYT